MLEQALALAAKRYAAGMPGLRRQLAQDYAQILQSAAFRNTLTSSGTTQELFERASQEVEVRLSLAWEACRVAVETAGLGFSPDLSEKLQHAVRMMTSPMLEESALGRPPGHSASLNIDTSYRERLASVDVDIDYFVMGLAAAAGSRPEHPAVFVSHIAEDAAVAAALKSLLQQIYGAKLTVFVASDYESIRSGAEWHGAILDAIRSSRVMVALLSEDSHERPWINYEVGAADIYGLVVVPTLIRGFTTQQLRPPLARRHARNLLETPGVVALVRDVGQALKMTSESANDAIVSHLITEASKPAAFKRLSRDAFRIAQFFCERSVDGTNHDPMFRASDLAAAVQLTDDELEVVLDELRESGFLRTSGDANSPIGIGIVSPSLDLFVALDPIVKGWTPEEDAMQLLRHTLTGEYPDGFCLSVVGKTLGWAPRRLNISAQLLATRKLIDADRSMGTAPYAFFSARVLPKGRRAAQDWGHSR